jgi:endonuclease YncB( thermonuclease family)
MRICTAQAAIAILATCLFGVAFGHPGGVDKNGCHYDSKTGRRHCHPERAKSTEKNRNEPPRAGDEGVFYGPFISIVDGDTFKAKVQGVVMDFRLESVDAPEHDQPYGPEATRELDSLIRGKQLVIVPSDTDRYGRTVARVWVDDLDVNRELVRRGAVWFESEYAKDDALYREEQVARAAKKGLWANAHIEPWIWRERRRESRKEVPR